MELIYSRQATDFIKGRAYANPRFYSRPREGVTKVYLVGEWPQIEADYKALDVEVVKLSDGVSVSAAAAAHAPDPARLPQALDVAERGAVEIPDGWADLPWPQLRKLAVNFAAEPVLNKGEATAAIQAEIGRRATVRAKAETPPAVEPGEDAEDAE